MTDQNSQLQDPQKKQKKKHASVRRKSNEIQKIKIQIETKQYQIRTSLTIRISNLPNQEWTKDSHLRNPYRNKNPTIQPNRGHNVSINRVRSKFKNQKYQIRSERLFRVFQEWERIERENV